MDENMEFIEEKPEYVIKPKFNILYELLMPTGRKIKKSLSMFLGLIILYVIIFLFKSKIDLDKIFVNINLDLIINTIFLLLIIMFFIKLIIHITFQVLQYKYLTYTFYSDHMVYEDSFLNQHRKTIEYSNIKEVEVRRTITDRILGYGIIIIYTNAENSNNGLVIYSIKNPKQCYDRIQSLIKASKNSHRNVDNVNENNVKNDKVVDEETKEISKIVDLTVEDEKKFAESLKNINND